MARSARKLAGPGCCCLLIALIVVLLFPSFMSAHYKANDEACLSNMKELARALNAYAQDWDETLPPSSSWANAAVRHIAPASMPRAVHCPDATAPYSYVFNVHSNRLRLDRLEEPGGTPIIYEGDSRDFNAAGDGKTIPITLRHNVDASHIGFADGHARGYRSPTFWQLNWENKPGPKGDFSAH